MPEQKKLLNSLSVFFPCLNEEQNIPLFIQQAEVILPEITDTYEIIIVNDGSKDMTKAVAEKIAASNKHVRVVNHETNLGYGAALKSGFTASRYEWVFFTDGDLQFDLKQLEELLPYTKTYSVVIGYRKKRAEGLKRALIAKTLKVTMDILYRLHVKDIDCAFKIIKKDVLKDIYLVSTGAFTSTELLYRLKKKGHKFKELPVDHYKRKYGNPTGNSIKVMIKGIKETVTLYFYLKFGLFASHYSPGIKNKRI